MTNDPTDQPGASAPDGFEADLAASMQAAAGPVTGAGATRQGVDAAIGRRRSLQRRRLGVVAAAVAVIALVGGAAALAGTERDEPESVVADGGPTTTDAVTTLTAPSTTEPFCDPVPVPPSSVVGRVALEPDQLAILQAAGLADEGSVDALGTDPWELTIEQLDALRSSASPPDGAQALELATSTRSSSELLALAVAFGLPLDGALGEALRTGEVVMLTDGQVAELVDFVRSLSADVEMTAEDGTTTRYRCPDGVVPDTSTTTPSTTTTAAPADPVTTTTITGVATTEPAPTTTTLPDRDWIPEDELAEGQEVWAVYVDALSIAGPPIDGEDRAGVGEDRMYEAMAMLHDAGYELSMVPLACDLGSADAVLPILPDGPPEATAEDTWAMGFYVDGPAQADRARARLGDEVLVVAPVRITCVDVAGPSGYRR